eukprot:scaffold468_cov430-Prasinococcus_capsulatus_cf.AAC.2
MPRWEDEQHEQHPLDSPALRGPFEYSEEEQRALEGNLAVDDGEWNAKSGGIGGRPRPRYCVLDKAWRASEASDVDFSPAGFRTSLKRALLDGRLYDFLVNDRYQEPKGHDVLTGEPLAMDLVSSYSCPSLRTYAEAGVYSPHACVPSSAILVDAALALCWGVPRHLCALSRLDLRHQNARGPTKWADQDGQGLQGRANHASHIQQPA